MTEKQVTIGQAIDQIIGALDSLKQEARRTAVEAACTHLGIEIGDIRASRLEQPPTPAAPNPPDRRIPPPVTDIRTFKEEKQPKSANKMACVIAFFLQELAPANERIETVNAKVLEKYFKQANYKVPKDPGQVLRDSKAGGYFDSATGKGEYKLNAVGYNLVAHNLPTNKDK